MLCLVFNIYEFHILLSKGCVIMVARHNKWNDVILFVKFNNRSMITQTKKF